MFYNIQVVIKAAERCINFCHNSIGVTKDEISSHKILQVVETVRKIFPIQLRLSGLSEGKSWFLSINKDFYVISGPTALNSEV